MTDKNMVKLLIGWGVPKEKHEAIIAKANKEDEEMDVNEFLTFSKQYAEPLLKGQIEKEAQKAGASGAIAKALKATYDATKDDNSPSFEEWKKTNEAKDYADVIKDSFSESKAKGVKGDDVIKELQIKLEAAMKENGETKASIEAMKAEYEGKIDKINLDHTLDHTLRSFDKKPLKESYYKIFLRELEDEGVEIKLHDNAPTLFKKGETAPMQNDKKTAFVTLADKYNNWSTENENLFVNSAGNQSAASEKVDLGKGGKVSEDGKHIIKEGHRPMPTYGKQVATT